MASFMASPLVRRRHDEGKNGRETQANCGANPPVGTGRTRENVGSSEIILSAMLTRERTDELRRSARRGLFLLFSASDGNLIWMGFCLGRLTTTAMISKSFTALLVLLVLSVKADDIAAAATPDLDDDVLAAQDNDYLPSVRAERRKVAAEENTPYSFELNVL